MGFIAGLVVIVGDGWLTLLTPRYLKGSCNYGLHTQHVPSECFDVESRE